MSVFRVNKRVKCQVFCVFFAISILSVITSFLISIIQYHYILRGFHSFFHIYYLRILTLVSEVFHIDEDASAYSNGKKYEITKKNPLENEIRDF